MMELLLVLLGAVLFVNMGLGIQKTSSRMQLSISARKIQTLIRQTQDQAYGEQAIYLLAVQPVKGRCIQVRSSKVLKEVKMPQGIKIEYANFTNGKLYFRRSLAPSMGGTIVLASKSHRLKITVLPVTGRVKIYPIMKE